MPTLARKAIRESIMAQLGKQRPACWLSKGSLSARAMKELDHGIKFITTFGGTRTPLLEYLFQLLRFLRVRAGSRMTSVAAKYISQ